MRIQSDIVIQNLIEFIQQLILPENQTQRLMKGRYLSRVRTAHWLM